MTLSYRWLCFGGLVAVTGCFNPADSAIDTDGGTDTDVTMSTTTQGATTTESTSTSDSTTMDPTDPTDPTSASATDSAGGSTGDESFCGDGTMDEGEECDDGDQESGDGCSAACLDESNRCEPALVGGAPMQSAGRMVAEGGYVAYARLTSPSGLRVLDVTNPASISQVGSYEIDTNNYPNWSVRGIALKDSHVVMAGDGPELLVVDITDPTTPDPVYFGGPNFGDGHIHIVGNLMYESYSVAETARVRDVTDITNPTMFFPSIGNPNLAFTNVGGFGNYGIVSAAGHIELWDTSTPSVPTFAGQMDVTPPLTTQVNRILADEDTIFLATSRGVILIDYNLPSVPEQAATILDGQSVDDIALRGPYLYVPVDNGLQVWDVSDPDDPEIAGNYLEVEAWGLSVALDEQYVYLNSDSAQLRVIEEMPGFCEARCGNNFVEYPEDCDDGNLDDGDSCPSDCSDPR